MKLIQYDLEDNDIYIEGTNQFGDFFVSAQCWKINGFHAGCYKKAIQLYEECHQDIDKEKVVYVSGHSMGASIGQIFSYLLSEKGYHEYLHGNGGFPACSENIRVNGDCVDYGNDPVPMLFRWFSFPCKKVHEGPKRVWWKINFKDHVRY